MPFIPLVLANGRNSRAAISGATPGPLSVTVTHTFPPVSSVNESTNRRRGGFTVRSASSALLKRLTTTCSSRLASPITVGSSGSSLPSIEISSMVKRYDTRSIALRTTSFMLTVPVRFSPARTNRSRPRSSLAARCACRRMLCISLRCSAVSLASASRSSAWLAIAISGLFTSCATPLSSSPAAAKRPCSSARSRRTLVM